MAETLISQRGSTPQMYSNWEQQESLCRRRTPPSSSSFIITNSPASVVWYKDTVADSPALTCLITEQELEPKPRFLHNPRGTLRRIYLLLLEREKGEIHGLTPGRQCPGASCYSRSGNVSAFNGIVNRNVSPRGSEED